MAILGLSVWLWLLLLALLAFLALLWMRGGGVSGAGGPPPAPPPYPQATASTAVVAGAPRIPHGQWSGPNRHARRTSEFYTFVRQWYDQTDPLDPLSPAKEVSLRLRLVHVPEENAEIIGVTNGSEVTGTPWWGAVTGDDGTLEVEVHVAGRESASSEQSAMQVIAEELDSDGRPLRGAVHEVTVVPSGQ